MTDQNALFDPAETIPEACAVCGATRQPGDDKARDCVVDHDRIQYGTWRSRPPGCLNTHNPETAPIPF